MQERRPQAFEFQRTCLKHSGEKSLVYRFNNDQEFREKELAKGRGIEFFTQIDADAELPAIDPRQSFRADVRDHLHQKREDYINKGKGKGQKGKDPTDYGGPAGAAAAAATSGKGKDGTKGKSTYAGDPVAASKGKDGKGQQRPMFTGTGWGGCSSAAGTWGSYSSSSHSWQGPAESSSSWSADRGWSDSSAAPAASSSLSVVVSDALAPAGGSWHWNALISEWQWRWDESQAGTDGWSRDGWSSGGAPWQS